MDLDGLIGEIRREAARRRAAPDFPLAEEAEMGAAMDRLGPVGSAADLSALVARLRAAGRSKTGPDPAELADLSASALNAISARLDHLERRVGRRAPVPAASPLGDGESVRLAARAGMVDRIVSELDRPGPVLVAGPGASAWVGELGAVHPHPGVYGVDPTMEEFDEAGPVRSGLLIDHFRSVAAGGLAGVVLIGPVRTADGPALASWAGELARIASVVVVCSEAPWAWRARIGEGAADMAGWRPLSPETWLSALTGSGFRCAGFYGPEGRDYQLIARRPDPDPA